jgi:hypothetical protein
VNIGAAVRLYTAAVEDIGVAHAPSPLELGDLLAREHGSLCASSTSSSSAGRSSISPRSKKEE